MHRIPCILDNINHIPEHRCALRYTHSLHGPVLVCTSEDAKGKSIGSRMNFVRWKSCWEDATYMAVEFVFLVALDRTNDGRVSCRWMLHLVSNLFFRLELCGVGVI